MGFLLLLVATLFPPWRVSYSSAGLGLPRLPGLSGSRSYASSYGFLFKPPSGAATIELSRLAVEWALIGLLASGLFFLFRKSTGEETANVKYPITMRTKRLLLISAASALAICGAGLSYHLATRKIVRDLPPGEVAKVTGSAHMTNYGSIELNAYNGSDLVLTQVTVSISVLDAERNAVISNRAYRLFPSYGLNPQSSRKFSADLGFTLEQGQTWQFTIVGAKGRPE